VSSTTQSNSFGTRTELDTGSGLVGYYHLARLQESGVADVSRLPLTIKVLLEAALRCENGHEVTRDDVLKLATYDPAAPARVEIPFKPARVLVQDFTGVPAIVDLAALRSAMARLGGDPDRVNPQIPVDLVIDHSVQVDEFGTASALGRNADLEFERNRERYELLHWGQKAFQDLTVVPPATGICHQVNLEHLATVVQRRMVDGDELAFPDSLVGLDSHTTMINGLGILGWGVGGIEAEAAMLGQPLFMLMPEVVGVRLTGELAPGTTATDLALVVTETLRRIGVVGSFVELFGPGLSAMSLPDRATIANMAPEYGATCGFFPVDDESLRYLRMTGRSPELIELVERYCKEQGLFRTDDTPDPEFHTTVEIDLSSIQPSLAGPRRPQDRIELGRVKQRWQELVRSPRKTGGYELSDSDLQTRTEVKGTTAEMTHGSVVIAAITSCTNTSNPSVLLCAGLLAKKAVEAGLRTRPYVKTSLAPGSKVVTGYLRDTGLMPYLEELGFHVVGYGCTTCIGNSGPLPDAVSEAIREGDLVVASVLSGNRNFEGRIHQQIRANFLASPPLVVAYALAGTVDLDLTTQPLGRGHQGREIYLRDIWPTPEEIAGHLGEAADPQRFRQVYARLLDDNETWNQIEAGSGTLYSWQETSTYIQEPPFFLDLDPEPAPIAPITEAAVLAKLGDSVTTDHISPAGAIAPDSPAGQYLIASGVSQQAFNSYGSRRGNDRVMTRGTFANIRLKNHLAHGKEGGWTTHHPSGELVTIHEAAQRYQQEGTPTIVLAGVDYGMGSSRDWAAKGTFLLGVRAVIARSFERIHRSNLVGMGVLPLQLREGEYADSLGLTGEERFTINIGPDLAPGQDVEVTVVDTSGASRTITVICRIDTPVELQYYRNGGILHTVLRQMLRR
jgi:aconitate hydratase